MIEEKLPGITSSLGLEGNHQSVIDSRYSVGTYWAAIGGKDEVPVDPSQLDPYRLVKLLGDPEYSAQEQEIKEASIRMYPVTAKQAELDSETKSKLEGLAQLSKARSKEHPGLLYRDKRSEALAYHRAEKEKIKAEYPKGRSEGAMAEARDIYNKLLWGDMPEKWVKDLTGGYSPIEPTQFGEEYNYYEHERRKKWLEGAFSKNFVGDMEALSRKKQDLSDEELKYREEMDYIGETGYWSFEEEVVKYYGKDVVDKYDEWQKAKRGDPDRAEDLYREQIKGVLGIGRSLEELFRHIPARKRDLRKRNAQLDDMLVYWGMVPDPYVEPYRTMKW